MSTTTATSAVPAPQGVHLVGSLPHELFLTETDVWTKVVGSLPGRLKRIPDGELGPRWYYVNWQESVFPNAVLRTSNLVGEHAVGNLDPSFVPQLEDIKPVRYDEFAISSYHKFLSCRKAGLIPSGVRFQVCLPSPVEAVSIHVHPAYQAQVMPLYETRLFEALRHIQQEIPACDLSIQWDVAVTFGFIEHERGSFQNPFFAPWFNDALAYTMEKLKAVSLAVEPDVELGYHLCYGDVGHKHFVEPNDMALLVQVANMMIEEVHKKHKIAWFHMPVPKARSDTAYFAPLKSLALPADTQLFLGAVHFGDLEGTEKRIAAAAEVAPKIFGVATECGMGRVPKMELDSLLDISREISRPY